MAEDGGSGEKTEEATPEKLRKAREEGQVSKSQDFVSALVFIGAVAAIGGGIESLTSSFSNFIIACIQAASQKDLTVAMADVISEGFRVSFVVTLPALSAAFVLALAGNYFQIGFLLTSKQLKPDLKKINPISGFKQLFSAKRLVELLKQVAKFTMVTWIVYMAIKDRLRDVIMTQRMDLLATATIASHILKDICIRVALLFLAIALADYFWQRYSFNKSMKMSMHEVKQEYKESEGDPEMKGERKRLAQELVMEGGQARVAKSDAVVTNPAHIAVAIQYDAKKSTAPIVVAKGLRLNADKIKEIARQSRVPILRNVPLAQALHKLDIDEEIPEELYEAVAEVLNFVYELKKRS